MSDSNITDNPELLALVICDQVICEEGTGKLSLIGTFNSIRSKSFPSTHALLTLYVAITGTTAALDVNLKLKRIHPDSSDLVSFGAKKVKVEHKTDVAEVSFCIKNLTFTTEGLYCFELWVNNVYLGEKRINVVHVKQQ